MMKMFPVRTTAVKRLKLRPLLFVSVKNSRLPTKHWIDPQAKMIQFEELCYQRKRMEIGPEMAEEEVTIKTIEENSQAFSLYKLKIPLLIFFFLFSLRFSNFSLFQNISRPQALKNSPEPHSISGKLTPKEPHFSRFFFSSLSPQKSSSRSVFLLPQVCTCFLLPPCRLCHMSHAGSPGSCPLLSNDSFRI